MTMKQELGHDAIMNTIINAINLMALSATTAPRSAGKDFVKIKSLYGNDVVKLGEEMIKYGQNYQKRNFDRDGANVKKSPAILLIGLKNAEPVGLNCGACGFNYCAECKAHSGPEFNGPLCAFRILDMGIAIGSAVKMAGIISVDNRIMYRAGVVAKKMGIIEADFVMGIPVSATGKNIYFDRK
mgnify:CR=1 FL=1